MAKLAKNASGFVDQAVLAWLSDRPVAFYLERTLGASSNAITCDHRLRHRDRGSSGIGSHAQRDAVRFAEALQDAVFAWPEPALRDDLCHR